MRTLFNLRRAPEAGRSDVDALLELKGRSVPPKLRGRLVEFELKSATGGKAAISTVRDFGLHHIQKWRRLHWLFGIYGRDAKGDQVLQYCLYGSPGRMKPWFDRMTDYVAPDVALAEHVPDLITDATLTSVLGPEPRFTLADARRVMKNQYGATDYRRASDLPNAEWWRAKITRNRERDRRVDVARNEAGWAVIRVWEHESPERAADAIGSVVQGRRRPK